MLDRTIFYATSGGQPGDTGFLERADGTRIAIAGTITGESKDEIIHIPAAGAALAGRWRDSCGWRSTGSGATG